MHLLYLTQYYVAEDQAGSIRHYRHANYLVNHGHRVTVVTSYVTHAERTIPAEYAGKKIHVERQGDLTVYRTYAYPHYKRDILTRLWNYATFMGTSAVAGLRVKQPDLVLASINPISVGLVGWFLSRLRRVPFVLEVCDLTADAAESMKVVRSRALLRLVRWIEESLFRRARRVIVLTPGIGDAVARAGVPRDRIEFVPMGIDLHTLEPTAPGGIRRSEAEFIALFVGVLNSYSGLETVLLAAEKLKPYPDIRFVLVGDGDQRAPLERLARERNLSNVTFHGVRPKREIPAIIAESDVCILPFRNDDYLRIAMPQKLYEYPAGGKPVIASAPEGAVTRNVGDNGLGLCVPPEQPDALAEAVLWMHGHPQEARDMGARGRRYMVQHFERGAIMERYRQLLEETAAR